MLLLRLPVNSRLLVFGESKVMLEFSTVQEGGGILVPLTSVLFKGQPYSIQASVPSVCSDIQWGNMSSVEKGDYCTSIL